MKHKVLAVSAVSAVFLPWNINAYCKKHGSVFRKTLQSFPWNTTIFFLNHRLFRLYYFLFSFTSITCPSASATTFRPVSPFSCTLMNFIVTSLPSIYSEQEYPNFSFFNCCISKSEFGSSIFAVSLPSFCWKLSIPSLYP